MEFSWMIGGEAGYGIMASGLTLSRAFARGGLYVSDLVEGLCRLMESDFNEPVNLGNDEEISMLELVRAIEKAIGKKVTIINKPLPQDDPTRRRPDLARAQKLLGYEPVVTLEDGLRYTIGYFARELGIEDPSLLQRSRPI